MNKMTLFCCALLLILSSCAFFASLFKSDDYGAALQDALEIFETAQTKTSGNLLSLKNLTGTKPSAEDHVGTFVENMKDRLNIIDGNAQALKKRG